MTTQLPTDNEIRETVTSGIERARDFAKSIPFEDVKSGQWFVELLSQVIRSYERNARADYFRQKYPGLEPDEIAQILTSVTVRYAAIAGAIAGVAASANQVALVASAGMSSALFLSSIGAEMIYLSYIQMRLVMDLSVVYDLQLDPEDPEDILMIFGYALGVAPSEFLRKGLTIASAAGAKSAVKTYVSKGTLKQIQSMGRRIGIKILQRTILKYVVPIVSAAVGSSYNYTSTLSIGKIAQTHMKNRGQVTEELRALVSKQEVYELVYPAAVMYVARVDGEYSDKERELYKAVLSRMSFEEHTQARFRQLTEKEADLLEEIKTIEDETARETLLELLILMAVYDGELVDKERDFLEKASDALELPLDMEAIEARAEAYYIDYQDGRWRKVAEKTGEALGTASSTSRNAFNSLMRSASNTGGRARRLFASESADDVANSNDE